jgi:hypothetical protein
MKTRIRILMAGAMLILALGTVVNGLNNTPRRHTMEADYPLYRSLADLVAGTDLVARGRVAKVGPAYRVIPPGVSLDQLPPHKREHIGYLLTDVVVRINTVLAGATDVADTGIVVTHPGGTLGDAQDTMLGEPLSRLGRSYLFFLRQAEDGRYVIVGGAQGRYRVRHGKLEAVSDQAKGLPMVKQLAGMDMTRFELDFDNLVRTSKRTVPPAEEVEEPQVNPQNLQPPAHKPSRGQ